MKGFVISKRPRYLWHELLRGLGHRSLLLRYRYQHPDLGVIEGRLWLCRCAADRFEVGAPLLISYNPKRPRESLPLRVALMRIPH